MTGMFSLEVAALLGAGRRLSDDEVTDLIEAVVDELDGVGGDPSVGTARIGGDVEMTVSVAVDGNDEWDALGRGVAAVRAAFQAAGIGSAGAVSPLDLRSHVRPLVIA